MTASVFDYRDINTRLRTIGRDASDRGGGDCDDAGDRATSQGRVSRERLDRTAFRVYFACGETSIGRQREAVENAAREILRVSSGSPSSSSDGSWESSDSPEPDETPETSDDSYVPPSSRRARSRAATSGRRRR